MLQVEGKTFHKFLEIKSFNTRVFKNYCPVEPVEKVDNYVTKKELKYFVNFYLIILN